MLNTRGVTAREREAEVRRSRHAGKLPAPEREGGRSVGGTRERAKRRQGGERERSLIFSTCEPMGRAGGTGPGSGWTDGCPIGIIIIFLWGMENMCLDSKVYLLRSFALQ
jgi:hypothetical protein